ncbi:MAG: RlmE family RNA methyltransferase [Bdellovibrionales bacterium]
MKYNPRDRFFQKAKDEGFRARSAYKLKEIQQKFRLIKSGDLVVDLGAAPGAWSQVALQSSSPNGLVVGLDLKEIDWKAPNARFYQMNVFEFDPGILENRKPDVLLSDMAPNTTGHRSVDQARSLELCSAVLDLAVEHLKPGGHCVMKVFEGPESKTLDKRMTGMFKEVKRYIPEAVRKGSIELYLVGLKKKDL